MPKPTPNDDPNVKIPAAIKAAAALSDKLHATAYATPEPEPPAEPEVPAVPQAPAEPPKAPEEPKTPPAPAAPEPPKAPQEVDVVEWKRRYESMKGRYDRSQDQIKGLGSQLSDLQRVVASLQAAQKTPPSTPAPERLITAEEEEEYGQNLLSVVGKKAKEEINPLVSSLKEKLDGLEARLEAVGGYVQEDAMSRMYRQMDEKLPTWRELNTDERFLEWLRLPDPFSGVIRGELLGAAHEQRNAPRVLAFFNGFLANEAAGAPTGEQDLPEPPPPAPAPKIPLETLAAPGRAKTAAAPPAPAEKPTFTRAQIAQLYDAHRRGQFRGRDAEWDRLEKQIFEASRSGRVLN